MVSLYTVEGIYRKAVELLEKGKRFALASVIGVEGSAPRGTTAKMIVTEDGEVYGSIGGGCIENYVIKEAEKVLKDGKLRIIKLDLGDDSWSGIGMACGGKVELAVELVEPQPRLILLGAGHLGRTMARLAEFLGFDVIVIDPLAKPEDFPMAEKVLQTGYAEGLSKITVKPTDNIVILTRHHADEEALMAAIETSAQYVGMIGSRNRVRMVFQELVEKGVSKEKLMRVYAPVGLDIGAETPEEISLSILAEILKVRRKAGGGHKKLEAIEEPMVKVEKTK